MAYTLLQVLNRVLKRTNVITGVSGELAGLTDSAKQTYIDVALQVINEGIHELYSQSGIALPQESATQNITLSTGTREYTFSPDDIESIRWPLLDETNGNQIYPYPGGYEKMRAEQLQPGNWTGLPQYAAINPTNGKLRMDVAPTANEDGRVYVLLYDKRINLTAASDTFPFSDTVVDAMVPVWSELWKREQRNNFDAGLMTLHYGRASRYLSKKPMRRKW